MKLITAMIRSERLEEVQAAITEREAYIICASEIIDLREPMTSTYRGAQHRTYLHRIRIEIVVVNDLLVPVILDAVASATKMDNSDRNGSGYLFVTPLEEWVRIPANRTPPVPDVRAVGGESRQAS